ncbi:MAG: GGDEF domain-containing protein [Deltaproteobacteria bacterium]|nr:GGDEF domain-containing protein [Deltaproteobacteria bacterium]
MAVVDALTGAYNKRYFEERLNEEFSYCLRNNVPLSLMMIDIDHFKQVNDSYGHPAGDFILGRVAALAKSIIRNEDIFARYGGEEFVAILKGTDAAGARVLAERLRKLIEESLFQFEENSIQITISIVLSSLLGKNHASHEEMVRIADQCLYQSKNAGRNRVSG